MNRTQPIDYKSVLSLFLPAGLLDYFDITEASNMGDYFMLVLVEKDIVPENLQGLPLISNGFHKPITVTDFPVRDHTMYFRIKRRLDYFDITEASNMGDYFMLVLVEKDIVPENLQGLPLISNGFHKPITVTDFPVRDHTMYFRIKRRRWLDKSTGKSYSRDWNLVASGTRITAEFGAFLKELP